MKEETAAALKVLQGALRTEKIGREFYLRAAEMTADQNGKRLFRFIAQEEMGHLRILQNEIETVTRTETWAVLENARAGLASPVASSLFPEEEQKVREIVGRRKGDLDALDLALDLERRGYGLYREEAEKARNLTARAVYMYLAGEEDRHFSIFQKTRQYLAENGAWLWDEMHSPQLGG